MALWTDGEEILGPEDVIGFLSHLLADPEQGDVGKVVWDALRCEGIYGVLVACVGQERCDHVCVYRF